MLNPSRKALEIAFRRWLSNTSPSRALVSLLRCQDRAAYLSALGEGEEIDHIIPLSMFDLGNPSHVRLAWSLDNVRRLPSGENKARGASIESAYLTMIEKQPTDEREHAALVAMVKPAFEALHPRLALRVEQ